MKRNIKFNQEYEILLKFTQTNPAMHDGQDGQPLLDYNFDWDCLVDLSIKHKLAPLLYKNLKEFNNDIVPNKIIEKLKGLYFKNTARNIYASDILVKILEKLDEYGVLAIPFKGPVLSQVLYGDIDCRAFSDLDILISPKDVLKALKILEDMGWRLRFKLSESQRMVSIKLLSCHTLYGKDYSISIDLQWGLLKEHSQYEYGLAELKDRLEPVFFFGIETLTFSKEDYLFYLCFHGTKHYWDSLDHILSINTLLSQNYSYDWDYIINISSDRRLLRTLLVGLSLSSELFDSPLPEQILELVKKDKKVNILVKEIIRSQLLKDRILNKKNYLMNYRESWLDKTGYYLNPLFRPQLTDIKSVPLSVRFSKFYYILRPLILLIRYTKGK